MGLGFGVSDGEGDGKKEVGLLVLKTCTEGAVSVAVIGVGTDGWQEVKIMIRTRTTQGRVDLIFLECSEIAFIAQQIRGSISPASISSLRVVPRGVLKRS